MYRMDIISMTFFFLLISLAGYLFMKKRKSRMSKKEILVIAILPLFLTAASLLISETKISGTVLQPTYGWPHFFLGFARKEIMENQEINQWFGARCQRFW